MYIREEHVAENGLRIRIDDDLRSEFIQTCRGNDQTAAQVLRAFMRQYVETNRGSASPVRIADRSNPTQQKQ